MRIHTLKTQSVQTPLVSLISRKIQIFQEEIEDFTQFLNFTFDESEVCLVPHSFDLWHRDYYDYILQIAKYKPVIYFNLGDRPKCKTISNSFSLQNVPCCQICKGQIIVPYNVQSFSFLPPRKFKQQPELSFVGYVPKLTPRRLLHAFEQNPVRPWLAESSLIRRANLRNIKKNFPDARIIKRSHYGGARTLIESPSEFRNEYIRVIKSSDLILCPRGDANASQRFFEVLSSGRIPVVPNTNIELPRFDMFKYSPVYLEVKPFGKDIKKRIHEFWTALDDEAYLSLQTANREIFQKFFTYNAFFKVLFNTSYSILESQFCRSTNSGFS